MQTLILKSENKEALDAIKTLATVLDISSTLKEIDNANDYEVVKGVKITRAKKKFNLKEMVGCLTDLNLEDGSAIRKEAWTRKKATW